MKLLLRIILIIISLGISDIINTFFIDSLLDTFKIMSFFALVANRVALALFIYFLLDIILIHRTFKFRNIMNKLFFIYFIWLIGLLFGRFASKNTNLKNQFNFYSFIPKWIHHLNHPLVLYYLIGNILVFIPFGMFIRYYKKLFYSLAYFILIICLFETLQAITHLGYFDIDDIILNGVGGLFGIIVMDIYKRFIN